MLQEQFIEGLEMFNSTHMIISAGDTNSHEGFLKINDPAPNSNVMGNITLTHNVTLGSAYFAEGTTLLNGFIYELTWTNGVVYKYNSNMTLV